MWTSTYITEDDLDTLVEQSFRYNAEVHSLKLLPALIEATQILEGNNYIGIKAVPGQTLKFPRIAMLVDGVSYTGTPDAIKAACFELALHLIDNPQLINERSSYNTVSAGGSTLSDKKNAPLVPQTVNIRIKPFLTAGGSNRLVRRR